MKRLFVSLMVCLSGTSLLAQISDSAVFYFRQGVYQADTVGSYRAAIPMFLKSLEFQLENRTGPDTLLPVTYNCLYHSYGYSEDWENALKYARIALPLYREAEKLFPNYTPKITLDVHWDLGNCFYYNRLYDSAEVCFEAALPQYQKISGAVSHDVALTLHELGNVRRYTERYAEAVPYYQRSIAMWEGLEGNYLDELSGAYDNLGNTYLSLGQIEKAKRYMEKSAVIAEEGGTGSYARYANLASALAGMDFYEAGMAYYEKALEEIEAQNMVSHDVVRTLNKKAETHSHAGEYVEALEFHLRARDMLVTLNGQTPAQWADHYIKLGRVYRRMGDYAQAQALLEEGLSNALEAQSALYIIFACDQLSLNYAQQGKFQPALEYRQYGLEAMLHNDFSLSEEDYHKAVDPKLVHPNTNFQSYLITRAELLYTYYRVQSRDPKDLDWAEQSLEAALEVSNAIEEKLSQVNLTFRINMARLHETYIKVALAQNSRLLRSQALGRAFSLIEQNKTQQVLVALRDNKARKYLGLPPSLLKQEQALNAQISQLNSEILAQYRGGRIDTLQDRARRKQKFDLEEEREALVRKMERDYPAYYQLKYNTEAKQLSDIQQLLDSQSAMVSYLWGDSSVISYTLTADTFWVHQHPFDEPLMGQLEEFRQLLVEPLHKRASAHNDWLQHAYSVYQQFVDPALKGLPDGVERLVIIPDGPLGFIPFETLVASPPSTASQTDFLIRNYRIQYAYSATLFAEQMSQEPSVSTRLYAGFAPEYPTAGLAQYDSLNSPMIAMLIRDGQLPLPGAQSEVQSIQALIGGAVFTASRATKEMFKQEAPKFRVLHLAMHALANVNNPLYSQLLFSPEAENDPDNALYAEELYNMRLNADLAVLSACNTGYGRYRRGEGIMSLSQAFAYAGCPSMVMSLWKIPDQESSEIMIEFYRQLKLGKTKDESLRQAKLTYLDQVEIEALAHPYFWAGMISLGNYEAMDMSDSASPVRLVGWGIIGVLLLATGIWYMRKRKRMRRS